jgi:hypothetical protein
MSENVHDAAVPHPTPVPDRETERLAAIQQRAEQATPGPLESGDARRIAALEGLVSGHEIDRERLMYDPLYHAVARLIERANPSEDSKERLAKYEEIGRRAVPVECEGEGCQKPSETKDASQGDIFSGTAEVREGFGYRHVCPDQKLFAQAARVREGQNA